MGRRGQASLRRRTRRSAARGDDGRPRRGALSRRPRLLSASRPRHRNLVARERIAKMNLRSLYPEIEPFETGMLDVGDGHSVYWERVGTKGAKPAVFLHGGPGGG